MPNNNQQHCMTFKINEDGSHNAAEIADFVKADSWDVNGDKLTLFNLVLVGKAQFSAMNGEDIIISGLNCEQQIEQEIQSKNLNAPRLTPADIDATIVDEYYFTAAQGVGNNCNGYDAMGFHSVLGTLTFCVLVLKNGFTVTGESACASPENFDPEIGKKVARENARNKVWMLEGYLLKEKLNHQIKIQEHFASQVVDAGKLQDSPIVSELPELEIKYSDAVKSTDPTNDNQACASGSASSNGYQLNAKRDNAFLVAQLLSNNKISAELRKKAETKMTALLDELI
nr:Gp49 family protein [Acinetobacter ursingii]